MVILKLLTGKYLNNILLIISGKISSYLPAFTLFLLLSNTLIFSQSSPDISGKNEDIDAVRKSNIKSKSVYEYRYSTDNPELLADSGYKSYLYLYDNLGRLTGYTKYHVFSNLTVKEVYQYSGDKIIQTMRYNSADEMIETIDYKYNSSGNLKKEIHTAYYNSVRPGVYFSILANVADGEVFTRLQNELLIEPKIESYTITVNISDPEDINQYIVIGDEMDPTSLRFSWSQLSTASQKDLLSYTGPNRKEHEYTSKNIAKVNYSYDKKSNLTKKSVYNTAGDIIDKEIYTYNGDNQKIAYYKYGEKGKISSMETFTYDGNRRLSESSGLDAGGKLISRLVYKYDDAGSLAEELWYNSDGAVNGTTKFSYNTQNQKTEEIKFRGEDEKEGNTDYVYDANGNISEIVKYNADGTKAKLSKYVYEYW